MCLFSPREAVLQFFESRAKAALPRSEFTVLLVLTKVPGRAYLPHTPAYHPVAVLSLLSLFYVSYLVPYFTIAAQVAYHLTPLLLSGPLRPTRPSSESARKLHRPRHPATSELKKPEISPRTRVKRLESEPPTSRSPPPTVRLGSQPRYLCI